MRIFGRGLLLAAALTPVTLPSVPSARVGIYAIVDSVSFEPAEGVAQRIRINGAFAYAEQHCGDCMFVADANRTMRFTDARKGFMYFQLPDLSSGVTQSVIDAMRREWSDIKSVAGTGQAIAFGSWKYAGDIESFREFMKSPNAPGYYINGKSAIIIRMYSLAPGADPQVYEANVGVIKLSAASHDAVIRQLRAAR